MFLVPAAYQISAVVFASICCLLFFVGAKNVSKVNVKRRDSTIKWKKQESPLITRWAKNSTTKAHLAYPRPQLRRKEWLNLNGIWDLAFDQIKSHQEFITSAKIMVPFPIQSSLSGVMKNINDNSKVWYRRFFSVPYRWRGKSVVLHFGAVDWCAEVWINGNFAIRHEGGYDSFSIDITNFLVATTKQEIILSVNDPTDGATQPRGKQRRNPHNIWWASFTRSPHTLSPRHRTMSLSCSLHSHLKVNQVHGLDWDMADCLD